MSAYVCMASDSLARCMLKLKKSITHGYVPWKGLCSSNMSGSNWKGTAVGARGNRRRHGSGYDNELVNWLCRIGFHFPFVLTVGI